MDRTMAKRKMLLKKMLNGHHMSAAGGDSLAAGGTKRDAVGVLFLSVVAEIQKQSQQTQLLQPLPRFSVAAAMRR